MNKKQALFDFEKTLREDYHCYNKQELIDKIGKTTLRVMWVDYIDSLAKNGCITDKQAYNWTQPVWIR